MVSPRAASAIVNGSVARRPNRSPEIWLDASRAVTRAAGTPTARPTTTRIIASLRTSHTTAPRVGVVSDSRYTNPRGQPEPVIFTTFLQTGTGRGQMVLHVRVAGEAGQILPHIRDEVLRVDPTLPALDAAADADVETNRGVGREILDLVLVRDPAVLLICEVWSDDPQAARVLHRERAPQDGVEQREDRGISADTQRQRQRDRRSKGRAPGEQAQREAQIEEKRVHRRSLR